MNFDNRPKSQEQFSDYLLELDTLLRASMNLTTFELNESIKEIADEIEYIRSICKHDYDENNQCVYCRKVK